MAQSLEDRIDAALRIWGRMLVSDMRNSINNALRRGNISKNGNRTGWKNPGNSDLSDSVRMDVSKGTFTLFMNDYWYYVDNGRKKTENGGNGAVRRGMANDWMGKTGINPSQLLLKIQTDYYNKKGIKTTPKPLKYDKAVKSLSYILSRAVHEKGSNPKPFFKEVWNEERKQQLRDIVGKELMDELIINFKD